MYYFVPCFFPRNSISWKSLRKRRDVCCRCLVFPEWMHGIQPSLNWWAFELPPVFCYYRQCFSEHVFSFLYQSIFSIVSVSFRYLQHITSKLSGIEQHDLLAQHSVGQQFGQSSALSFLLLFSLMWLKSAVNSVGTGESKVDSLTCWEVSQLLAKKPRVASYPLVG